MSMFHYPRRLKTAILSSVSWMQKYNRQRKTYGFLKQFISDGDLVFDVGANIGEKSELYLSLGAQVIAVEPQKDCIKALQERFQTNPNVTIVRKALDDCVDCNKELYKANASTISSMSREWIAAVQSSGRFPASSFEWNYKVQVSTTTLDELIKIYGTPTFVKIDTEGHEANILRGLSVKLKTISFEFVPERIQDTFECIRTLQNVIDYRYNFTLEETSEFALPTFVKEEELRSRLQLVKPELWGDVYAVSLPGNG